MNTDDTPPLDKYQKVVPATLLKKLRATAAVICLDYCLSLKSMTTLELQKRIYNMYHGNADLNIVSQVDLLYNGKSNYAALFRVIEGMNLDQNAEPSNNEDGCQKNGIINALNGYEDAIHYKCGTHLLPSMLLSPSKTKLNDKCSGRFLWDLSRAAICNIKKAVVIAEEWLGENNTPSGTNWDDLYHHLLLNYEKINPKEKVFIGFGNFICHSKYNNRGENLLNCLATSEKDGVTTTSKSRKDARKLASKEKDSDRSSQVGNSVVQGERGLKLDSRLQIIEIAQFEDAKDRDNIKSDLEHLRNCNKLLLEDRGQEIQLAKFFCPEGDDEDEHCIRVKELSTEIQFTKKQINDLQIKKDESF